MQAYATGLERHTVDTIAPIFRRGVLLDIPKLAGVDVLPTDFIVTPEHMDAAAAGVAVRADDVVLIRTGWARYWDDPARFISEVHSPGRVARRRAMAERDARSTRPAAIPLPSNSLQVLKWPSMCISWSKAASTSLSV